MNGINKSRIFCKTGQRRKSDWERLRAKLTKRCAQRSSPLFRKHNALHDDVGRLSEGPQLPLTPRVAITVVDDVISDSTDNIDKSLPLIDGLKVPAMPLKVNVVSRDI